MLKKIKQFFCNHSWYGESSTTHGRYVYSKDVCKKCGKISYGYTDRGEEWRIQEEMETGIKPL